MFLENAKEIKRIERTLAWYNMIPNVIWSVLNLTPISMYCFRFLDPEIFYTFLVISITPIFFKRSFINKLQIGKTVKTYRRLGVHLINQVAQNGVIINSLVKRKFPRHKIVSRNKTSISSLISQTYMFEKFHLMLFTFFCMANVYALSKRDLYWACIILLTNVMYNIYPNLLQQFIRLKLVLFIERTSRKSADR